MTAGRSIPVVLVAALLAGTSAARAESYGVFCANRQITIDARSEEEMKAQRGACQFARFGDRSSAENFARRNFGKVGADCSCR